MDTSGFPVSSKGKLRSRQSAQNASPHIGTSLSVSTVGDEQVEMSPLQNAKAFSCKSCGGLYDAFPPDDVHTIATISPPERKLIDSGLVIEIPYICDCGRENVLYWHNPDKEKGDWLIEAVDEDFWLKDGNVDDHFIRKTNRPVCKVCGSKDSFLVKYVLRARSWPVSETEMRVDYFIRCANKDCRRILARVKFTKEGGAEEWE